MSSKAQGNIVYHVCPVTSDNFEVFLNLFEICRPDQYNRHALINKYQSVTVFANGLRGFIAVDPSNNEAVAFLGVLPVKDFTKGESRLFIQAVDGITHPDHRRKGLFELLKNEMIALSVCEGVKLIFGVPNPLALLAWKKFGWDVREMTLYSVSGNLSLFQRTMRRWNYATFYEKRAKKMSVDFVSRVEIIPTSKSFIHAVFENPLDRSPEYLRYKLHTGTAVVQLPSGFAWIRCHKNVIEIGDVFGDDHRLILSQLCTWGRKYGVEMFRIVLPPSNEATTFFPGWTCTVYETPMICNDLSATERPGFIFGFSGGDFDTF